MRFSPVLRLAAAFCALSASAFGQSVSPATLPLMTARVQAAVNAGQAASKQTHEALAARQQMLLDVMRKDPGSARAYALPMATRQALLQADPTTATLLEYEVNKTGELTESVADHWNDGSSETRYGLHTATADLDLALPAGVLATVPVNHHLITVRGLAMKDVVAADRLVEASPDEAATCAPVKSTLATDPKSTAPATCSPLGLQRIAVLIVKFPAATPALPTGLDTAAYWNQVLFGANPSVNAYWNEVSQGQTSATGDVYGPFQLSAQYDCTTTSAMQTAAIAAAAGTVDFTQYNRIIIVYPVTQCDFGGLGNLGCVSATTTINHQYSVVWLPISSNYKPDFMSPQLWGGTSHELGHNLGLNHGNTLDFNAISLGPLDFSTTNPGTVVGNGAGSGGGSNLAAVNTEYGDNFDVMGYPWISGGPYNAVHRTKILGWIPQTDERDITDSGTYTLVPAENASGLRALHILRDPTSTSWLWVEYHQSIGYYESGNFTAHTQYGDTETTGAQIHYDTPFTSGSNPYTYLLDMTPAASTTTGNNNFYDGTLAPGKSWSDPYSLLTISTVSQTSAGLVVNVSYDTPCATLALNSSTITAAGGAGTLTITAPSSCNWTVSSNATWITFPGATTGSGTAVIPFTASANTTTAQRNTYLSAQRQSVGLVQPGTNITLQSISPNSGTSVAGTITPFTLAFSDAAGLSDVNQLNFDYSGLGTPDCQLAAVWNNGNPYLYLLTNNAYGNGVQVGGAGSISSPSCNISGAASSVTVTGNSATLTLGLTFTPAFLGEHNITANAYGKTANTATIPLGVWTVTAQQTISATTTKLTANPATTSSFGQSVVFTATVSSGAGTVNFLDGTTSLGTGTIANGVATLTTAALTVGSHSITAAYAGDANDAASTSSVLVYTVTQQAATATSTTLIGSTGSIYPSGSVTLTARVTPSAGTTPTGNVSFSDGGQVLATMPLTAGAAAYTASGLSVGSHSFTAAYVGSPNAFAPSVSNTYPVVVSKLSTNFAVQGSASTVFAGGSVTLTATPSASGAAQGAQTAGSMTFLDGATTLGTVTFANGGTASYTVTNLAAGPHVFGAVYSGSSDLTAAIGSALTVAVQDFALSVPSSSATLNAGTGESFPISLIPGSTGFTTAVALTCSGAPAQATCSIAPGAVTPGTGVATATLNIITTARPAPAAGWLLIALAPGLLALRRKTRKRVAGLLAVCAAFAMMALASGCGQGNFFDGHPGSGGTPAGTYTLTVSGVATGATTLTHTATVTLTVK